MLKGFPTVEDAVVLGLPDERWGESVTALVQLRPNETLDTEALLAHCRAHLASYKAPRRIEVVAAVPRHPSGKPDYGRARRQLLDEHLEGSRA